MCVYVYLRNISMPTFLQYFYLTLALSDIFVFGFSFSVKYELSSLTAPYFMEVPGPSQECERSYSCVYGVTYWYPVAVLHNTLASPDVIVLSHKLLQCWPSYISTLPSNGVVPSVNFALIFPLTIAKEIYLNYTLIVHLVTEKSLKIPKGWSETVNRRRTELGIQIINLIYICFCIVSCFICDLYLFRYAGFQLDLYIECCSCR